MKILTHKRIVVSDNSRQDSSPASRRSSLLIAPPPTSLPHPESPQLSRPHTPVSLKIPPPNPRFATIAEDDLKISEIPELVRDYKRLVEAIRSIGGFDE